MWQRWRFRIEPTTLIVWGIGVVILAFVLVGTVSTLGSGMYSLSSWGSFLIFGLAQGAIYALIALGYTMVYGVLFMINFAHSEVFMSGPYIAYFVITPMARSGLLDRQPVFCLLLTLLVAMLVSTTLAVTLERVAYRPLRKAPRLVPLITAIGASFFLQYAFRSLFGADFKVYPDVKLLDETSWYIDTLQIRLLYVVIIVAAVAMMAGLYLFIRYTKTGKAIRAVAEDKDVAALMGIDVNRVISTTFAIGGALAGAAGVLYALMFKQITHTVGFIPGIKAFTCAVLGGIGNIPGAMFGGFFLGIFESLGPTLFFSGWGIPSPTQLKDVIAFTMLVLVLIFRPTGLLGEVLARKKA